MEGDGLKARYVIFLPQTSLRTATRSLTSLSLIPMPTSELPMNVAELAWSRTKTPRTAINSSAREKEKKSFSLKVSPCF